MLSKSKILLAFGTRSVPPWPKNQENDKIYVSDFFVHKRNALLLFTSIVFEKVTSLFVNLLYLNLGSIEM